MARPADRRPLTRTSARRPCRCPMPAADPFPLDRSHRQSQVAPFRPVVAVIHQHHQRRLALAGLGAQMAGRGLAGPTGRAHQDDVDAGQQVSRRFGPSTARVWHEDHTAQVDAEFSGRHHPGVGQADRGTPAPRLRCRGEQRQRQRGRPVAGQPGHGGRRPPSQRSIGEEGDQGGRYRQEPSGHRRGRSDPVGQSDRELPGTGGRALLRT